MTQPLGGPVPGQHPFDPGNPFVQQIELPAALAVIQVHTSNGPRLLVTVRSGGATLSWLLPKDDAVAWSKALVDNANQLSSLVVPSAGLTVVNGHGSVPT
jgi:hypothetical protein